MISRLLCGSPSVWSATARCTKRAVCAASALVCGEIEAADAANKVADQLFEQLGGCGRGSSSKASVLFFAKGYGSRSESVGPVLKERFGGRTTVAGCNSEGGVLGNGQEVQNGTFALSALAFSSDSLHAIPFYSPSVLKPPQLETGLANSSACALTFCSLPMADALDPQIWVDLLQSSLSSRLQELDKRSDKHADIVGGLAVGGHFFVDGEAHASGGAFGMVLSGASFNPVVCQGAQPFGPWLKVTSVEGDHIISGLDGRNPKEVLEPILFGPDVPGEGLSMAGIFVSASPTESKAAIANAALAGRPSCVLRPMHAFTEEGNLILSPLAEAFPYSEGMQLQVHCFSATHALSDLQSRAAADLLRHGGKPPDAAVIVSCGARGVQLYGHEGVESRTLREVWGKDVPTVGIFAGGEIGPVCLRTYLHSYTTCCLMIRFFEFNQST